MKLGVTHHAVDRYIERVKPQLGREQARLELEALSGLVDRCARPAWFFGRSTADYYLQVGPEAVAAVVRCAIVTVVTRDAVEVRQRAARNRWKSVRRHRKSLKRKEFKKRNRRPELREEAA